MAVEVFYTVLLEKDALPVKYVVSPGYYVQTFYGPFGDPGEASQEFQVSIRTVVPSAECSYLEEVDFQEKVRAFAKMRREDRAKLKAWNGGTRFGKGVCW